MDFRNTSVTTLSEEARSRKEMLRLNGYNTAAFGKYHETAREVR